MALLSAVAALLGVLLLCPDIGRPSHGVAGPSHGGDGITAGWTVAPVGPHALNEYLCPYDRGDCRLLPALSPAVLTAPPPAAPVEAAGPVPRAAASDGGGRIPRSGARPRAPDLHVLQVLRT
ncbi:hypothetical protein AB0C77_14535 [Streptomyces sp. NPDC048629]|uniref:hypothetical protein n=1 Tax=Streptomyces sp. NPDC048629 TaxID=3154824 RepID=UPI00344A0DCF